MARALPWHGRGHRFDSDILHEGVSKGHLLHMIYFVYILYSEKCNKYYVGHTDSIERRVYEHNNSKGGAFSSSCAPWKFLYNEKYDTRTEAMIREKVENNAAPSTTTSNTPASASGFQFNFTPSSNAIR